MPAHSNEFPWPSYYGNYNFFEARMNAHNRVRSVQSLGNGRYQITKEDNNVLQVFVCECYSFGVAEYMETIGNLGSLDAVIINSNWCGYTEEVKLQCRAEKVGIFTIVGFMAALNRPDFWTYLDEWEMERFKKRGLL